MKQYIEPKTEVTRLESEGIMVSFSTNAGLRAGGYGYYDPR